ncbi:hypothetical protein [Streptomyces nymphaeiformis]|uniref:Uncharacterized protein n=1 Tax=Streptomyces nymphaeiformis TaxID=2663842 RepID=A0A7W7U519_9ACTN|nr:hypothetical protein [Streptomyces nymphaeiformis]MBB4985018.1 hypothetical protein [Streptomyces nymphaeiformis]
MASFADDFNRADNTDLGAGWVEVSGDWSIVSNQLSPGSTGGTIILRAAGAMDSNDHSAQVTITATTAASHGVWCRGNSGISNGYLWRNDGSEWTLFSVVSSTFTAIGSYAAAAAPGDVAKIQTVGSTIKGFVNGVQRVSVTDTAVASGTSVGLRSTSSAAIRFDDFAAADVTAGVALTAATEADNAQSLAGSKTASLAGTLEADAAQALTGAKVAALLTATATETAQALTASRSQSLAAASSSETAQPLAGAKTAILGVAVETSTARPLATAGGSGIDTVTAGTPHTRWTVGRTRAPAWTAGTPRT